MSDKLHTMRLSSETIDAIKDAALQRGISQGRLIEAALAQYLAQPDDSPPVRRLSTLPLKDRVEYGSIVLANLHATGHFAIHLYDGTSTGILDLPRSTSDREKSGEDRPAITSLGYNEDDGTFQVAVKLPYGTLRKRK